MFNKKKAYHHLTSLVCQRGTGSTGEKKARNYIIQTLTHYGIKVTNQVFTFSKITDNLTRIVPFLAGVCLWGFTVVFPVQSWKPVYLLVIMLLVLLSLSFFPVQIGKLHKMCAKYKGTNIIGRIPSLSESKHHIVFLAHYDSKSQTLAIAIRTMCIVLLVLSLFLIILSHLLSFLIPMYPFININRLSGYLSLLSGFLLFINFTRNSSPGASDNASGVSIVLELARIFSQNPLVHTRITILLTSAEEYGMAGAFYYSENNALSKSNTSIINIDGVGDRSPVCIVRAKKTIFSRTGRTLFNEIGGVARSLSLPFKFLKTPVGIGFDHIPLSSRGFCVVTLCSYSIKMVLRIHSKRDTVDHVSINSLDSIGQICEKYARECDFKKKQEL